MATDDNSNWLINAQQSQSRVLHTSPDQLKISRVIESVQASVLKDVRLQANYSVSVGPDM